ncbi:hypothetical protein RND81_05G061500 [Saponaria officinalis]|uniref:Reverse transcriptase zinc-binding domain-containing protein n=1 Tax=Saponaria officinalis TaxID=3572 RepID=A0AAW1KV47_SAPOF
MTRPESFPNPKLTRIDSTQTRPERPVCQWYKGYWLGLENTGAAVDSRALEQDARMWKSLWSLRVPPKLIHFLWRACTSTLGVKQNLFRRHCCPNALCGLCEVEAESEIHALFECSWTLNFWARSGFSEIVDTAPRRSFTEFLEWSLQQIGDAEKGRFLAIIWAIWTIRNSRTFDQDPFNPDVVILGFTRLVDDYQGFMSKEGGRLSTAREGGAGCGRRLRQESLKLIPTLRSLARLRWGWGWSGETKWGRW